MVLLVHMKTIHSIHADVARKLVETYKISQINPDLQDIFPYIEEHARLGATELPYGISTQAPIDALVLNLRTYGYTVEIGPIQGDTQVLIIKW